MLNTKNLNIDCDQCITIINPKNNVTAPVNFTRGNTYILQANCYSNSATYSFASFDPSDTWEFYIGRQFESNAYPVVSVLDAGKFNQVSDWSLVNVAAGMISAKVDISSEALTEDMANLTSQAYTMELVLTNGASNKVMVCDTTCIINNAVQK